LPLQRLRHQSALLDRRLHGGSRCRHRFHPLLDHGLQLDDQILIVAFRLGFGRLEPCEDFLDAVDAAQDQRDRFRRHRHAVAKFAHQGLAGMRKRFQPRQTEKAAGALHGVNQAKDVIENPGAKFGQLLCKAFNIG